jgi:hypothetical protein
MAQAGKNMADGIIYFVKQNKTPGIILSACTAL